MRPNVLRLAALAVLGITGCPDTNDAVVAGSSSSGDDASTSGTTSSGSDSEPTTTEAADSSESGSTDTGSNTPSTSSESTGDDACDVADDCPPVDDPCRVPACNDGVCGTEPVDDGATCDDGLFCTTDDACGAGVCVGGAPPSCEAPDACNDAVCDEERQACVAVPANEGGSCDDGDACSVDDACSAGSCAPGAALDCSFLDGVCAVGVCDPQIGCQAAADEDGVPCDDDDGCTIATTCAGGACGEPVQEIVACVDDDACCPAGCADVDGDCLYWASGVQQDVPDGALTGWSQCMGETYGDVGTDLAAVLAACDGANLMLACRPVGAPNWTLLAMAPRGDVLFDCGSDESCVLQSNGVGWYYSSGYSWGFAPGGEPVNRDSCDYDVGNQSLPEQRLCWHTDGGMIDVGYRCGANELFDDDWERAVFEAG